MSDSDSDTLRIRKSKRKINTNLFVADETSSTRRRLYKQQQEQEPEILSIEEFLMPDVEEEYNFADEDSMNEFIENDVDIEDEAEHHYPKSKARSDEQLSFRRWCKYLRSSSEKQIKKRSFYLREIQNFDEDFKAFKTEGLVKSASWGKELIEIVQHNEILEIELHSCSEEECEACCRKDHPAAGAIYFNTVNRYAVGRFCLQRIWLYHTMWHFKSNLIKALQSDACDPGEWYKCWSVLNESALKLVNSTQLKEIARNGFLPNSI